MKVKLQFRFPDGQTCYSETVPLNFRIRNIPYRAKEYRPFITDYRGFKEGMALIVRFVKLTRVGQLIEDQMWTEWGSLDFDDFKPIPKETVFAKIRTKMTQV